MHSIKNSNSCSVTFRVIQTNKRVLQIGIFFFSLVDWTNNGVTIEINLAFTLKRHGENYSVSFSYKQKSFQNLKSQLIFLCPSHPFCFIGMDMGLDSEKKVWEWDNMHAIAFYRTHGRTTDRSTLFSLECFPRWKCWKWHHRVY